MILLPPMLALFLIIVMMLIMMNITHGALLILPTINTMKVPKKQQILVGNQRHWRQGVSTTLQELYSTSMPVPEDNRTADIIQTKVLLSSGTGMEVVYSHALSKGEQKRKPLIFLHGSFHAAWCWTEHYFAYFTQRGYSCYALNFQGTGGTPTQPVNSTKVKMKNHVQDLVAFIDYVSNHHHQHHLQQQQQEQIQTISDDDDSKISKPILIAHSFAGLAVMKYLETLYLKNNADSISTHYSSSLSSTPISGIIIMCSVPPSGNGQMTLRFLRRSFIDSWKITMGMAFKKCLDDKNLCRTLFFGGQIVQGTRSKDQDNHEWGIRDSDVIRYQEYFRRDTVATIDLGDLAKNLPSKHIDSLGQASFVDKIPPTIVVGATNDFIVDKQGVMETATYFGVQPTFIDSPHDVMLGSNHTQGAKAIEKWLHRNMSY